MKFKLVPKRRVIKYILKHVLNSKNQDRVDHIKDLFESVAIDGWKVLFGFQNEYGEKYLAVEVADGNIWWFGDESDWTGASSYYEDKFIKEIAQAKKYKITIKKGKIKL